MIIDNKDAPGEDMIKDPKLRDILNDPILYRIFLLISDFKTEENRKLLMTIIRDCKDTMNRYYAMENLKGFDWESAAYNDHDPEIQEKAVKRLKLDALERYIKTVEDLHIKDVAIRHHALVMRERENQKRKTDALKTTRFGLYDWRTLDVQDGRVLLLSDRIIDQKAFQNERGTTWKHCSLRKYLNGEFFNSFNAEERDKIIQTKLPNNDAIWNGIKGGGGKTTNDKIFLLSVEDVVKYFGDSNQMKNRGERAYKRHEKVRYPEGPDAATMWEEDLYTIMSQLRIDDQYNSKRIAVGESGIAWWWLRSPAQFGYDAAFVDKDGTVCVNGTAVGNKDGGVRPAMWVDVDFNTSF